MTIHASGYDQRPIVLIVDDEPDLVEALASRLRKRPYRVITATSPVDALLAFHEHEVAVNRLRRADAGPHRP